MKTYTVETTIHTTPEVLWRALTDGDVTEQTVLAEESG